MSNVRNWRNYRLMRSFSQVSPICELSIHTRWQSVAVPEYMWEKTRVYLSVFRISISLSLYLPRLRGATCMTLKGTDKKGGSWDRLSWHYDDFSIQPPSSPPFAVVFALCPRLPLPGRSLFYLLRELVPLSLLLFTCTRLCLPLSIFFFLFISQSPFSLFRLLCSFVVSFALHSSDNIQLICLISNQDILFRGN